jgi:GTPase Era involved in 16S rRNA processing
MRPKNLSELKKFIREFVHQAHQSEWFDQEEHYELKEHLFEIEHEANEPVCLSFCGNFSVGKSMVINSLLGEMVAQTDVRKTTAIVCHFRYGDTKKIIFHYKDGSSKDGEVSLFEKLSNHQKLNKEEKDEIKSISHIEIYFPSNALREITIIDTPGFGSDTEADDSITKEHIEKADAVCWVFDANEVGKKDEFRRIEKFKENFRAAFALVNKCDEIPSTGRIELRDRIKSLFPKVFQETYLYSAETVIDSQTQDLEIDETTHLCMDLVAEIQKQVKDKKEELAVQKALQKIDRILTNCLEEIKNDIHDGFAMICFLDKEFPLKCEEHSKELISNIKRRRDTLNNNIQRTFSSAHIHFKKCVKIEKGWFVDDYGLDNDKIDELFMFFYKSFSDSFLGWNHFLELKIKISLKTLKAFFREGPVGIPEENRKEWEEVFSKFDEKLETRSFMVLPHSYPMEKFLSLARVFQNTFKTVISVSNDIKEKFAEWLYTADSSNITKFTSSIFENGIAMESFDKALDEGVDSKDGLPLVAHHVETAIEYSKEISLEINEKNKLLENFLEWMERFIQNQ